MQFAKANIRGNKTITTITDNVDIMSYVLPYQIDDITKTLIIATKLIHLLKNYKYFVTRVDKLFLLLLICAFILLESFKIKFGLVEPKKTDKEIESLIYKIGRNIKDSWRKIQKKNVNKDDVAGQNKDDWNALLRNGCRRKTGMEQDKGVKREENAKGDEKSEENKKAAKKTKGAKQVSEETTRSAAKNVIAAKEDKPKSKKRKIERDVDAQKDEEATQAAEEEDKKAKKAAKKARKAKEAALENDARKDEEATRAAEEATRAAEEDKKAKKAVKKARKAKKAADTARDDDTRAAEKATPTAEEEVKQREDIPRPKKNRAERGDRFESKGKVKKCKKE